MAKPGFKKQAKDIARQRVQELFQQAEKRYAAQPALAHRYVTLARTMAMKYKVRMPPELKRRVCKHCHHYLVPGKNCRVRTQTGNIVYTCKDCGRFNRYAYR